MQKSSIRFIKAILVPLILSASNLGYSQKVSKTSVEYLNLLVIPDGGGNFLGTPVEVPQLRPTPFMALSGYTKYIEYSGEMEYRYFSSGVWSDWIPFTLADEGGITDRVAFDAHFLESSVERLQFRSTVPLEEGLVIRIYYPGHSSINDSNDEGDIAPSRLSCPCPQPSYCNRSCWDPWDECPVDNTPSYTSPTHMIVHHSAGQTTSSDFPAVIRSYWNTHVYTHGWDDIAYNWLIDGNGVLYEGRGDGVLGAHFSCMNTATMGVCVIGNYETSFPTTSALGKLYDILAWEACDKGIAIPGTSYHGASSLVLNHISGHRDGNNSPVGCPLGTVCPGNNIYNQLGSIRNAVAAEIMACGGSCPPPSNDACSSSVPTLIIGTSCNSISGDIACATQSYSASTMCPSQSTLVQDVWYRFTATSTGTYTVRVDPSGGMDAVVEIRQSSCTGSTLGCEDDGGGDGDPEELNFSAVNGTTYYVRVYDWTSVGDPPTTTTFDICVVGPGSGTCPDPTISSLTFDPPSPSGGQEVDFDIVITNVGSASTVASDDPRIEYWVNGVYTGEDDDETTVLGPGDSNTESLTNYVFSTPGTYTVCAILDPYPNECPTNNNTFCQQITVSGQLPDLVVSDVSLNYDEVCPGQFFEVSYTVSNDGGTGSVSELTQTGFWVLPSNDPCPDEIPLTNGIYVDDVNLFSSEMADDMELVSNPVFLPELADGNYILAIVVDHDTDQPELDDELNNIMCVPFTVNTAAQPVAAVIDGNLEICSGESTTLSITNYDFVYQTYLWSTGSTNGSITVNTPGNYSVLVSGNGNCSESVVTEVFVSAASDDSDGDEIPDCADDCPSAYGQVGSSCNDQDPCTINDMLNANCQCVGTTAGDADSDGLCDTIDPCPSLANAEPGTACDDTDDCTTNDVYDANCVCAGTFQDTDGDGTCNAQDGCPNDPNKIAPGICGCGVADTDMDSDGLADCVDPCPALANFENGDPCDDGNPNTVNDVVSNCICAGTLLDDDCEGVPGGPAQPGTACDDTDDCTINDVYDSNCVCAGTFQDTDGDGTCDAQDGCPNDPNKIAPGICGCGVADTDMDSDGLADCVDPCPALANLENGDPCDDGNPNTVNDVVSNCICAGTLLDDDCEGVPGGPAQPGTACDDTDDCTINDVYDSNCVCAGTFQDTDGDGTCDALDLCNGGPEPSTACDDGDVCTINDLVNASCSCTGTVIDLTIDTLIGPTDVPTNTIVTYSVTPVLGASSYVWSFTPAAPALDWSITDTDTTDATAVLQTGPDPIGAYVCVVAMFDTCAGNEMCLSFSTGLGSVSSSSEWFTIHPNPSNGSFEITPAGLISGTIDIQVYDALGQLVAEPIVLTGKQPHRLDLQEQANGIYFLRANKGNESHTMELLIQR